MKQTLIKITDDHYVVVDDSEIKEGDWCLYANKFGGKFICQAYIYERTLMFDDGSFNRSLGEGITPQKDECKKITHSTQPLEDIEVDKYVPRMPIYDKIQQITLSEVKELIGEVDVEKKMISPYPMDTQNDVDWCNGYQRGYNQAIEDNKDKRYTERDLWRAFEDGKKGKRALEFYETIFQPKTEWEVTFNEQGKLRLL